MTTPQEVLLETLEELRKDEFKKFKWFLNQKGAIKGFESIQAAALEDADRFTTVSLMASAYGDTDALKVAQEVFKKLRRNDLVQKISESINEPKDPKRDTEQSVQAGDWLKPVWTDLINRLSPVNIKQLLDKLYQQDIINGEERDDVMEEKTTADKARKLIEGIQKKGPDAVSCLKTALCEVNRSLCRDLNLL